MANQARRLQTNFNGGELSPYIEGRPDLAKFFNGARRIENFILQVEGGAFYRYGTRFIAEAKFPDKYAILVPFTFNLTNEYLLEIGEEYIRIYRDGVRIQQTTSSQIVTNGTFTSDITGWTDVSAGNGVISWESGRLKLRVNSGGGTARARQGIPTAIGTTYTLTFDVITNPVALRIGAVAGASGVFPLTTFPVGSHSVPFTAQTATTWLDFQRTSTSSGTGHIDNVSSFANNVAPLEITTPWLESELKDLQWKQSADVVYFVHPNHQQRKLSRVSDTNWSFGLFVANPPPTAELDEDISAGTVTLTPDATTGTGVTFTLSSNIALPGDVGRMIISGAGRGSITAQGGTTYTVDIMDDFASASAIPAGSWFLRLSPQTHLDPNKKGPKGAVVELRSEDGSNNLVNAFRTSVVGKYIKVAGGMIKVTARDSASQLDGVIIVTLDEANNDDPAAQPPGSWSVETPSWSAALGWPRAIEFHQGRLWFGYGVPATIAGSASDDFENFATGINANNAVVYGLKSVNPISWLVSLRELFIGDPDKEKQAKGPGVDEPLGGDVLPFVTDEGDFGAMHTLPITVNRAVIFIKELGKRLVQFSYNWEQNAFSETDLNVFSRHIYETSRAAQHPPVYVSEPNQIIYTVREDGQAAVLSYYRPEEVFGWSRLTTNGQFLTFAAVRSSDGTRQEVYTLARRTVDGAAKTYIEKFVDRSASVELNARGWTALYTDSAIIHETIGRSALGVSAVSGVGVVFTCDPAIPVFTSADEGKEIWELRSGDGLALGQGRAIITQFVSNIQVIGDVLFPFSHADPPAFPSGQWAKASRIIPGLSHLNGLEVDVIAAHGYLGRYTVASDQVVLNEPTYLAEIGIPYTGTIQTMRPSMQNAMMEGLKRRWNDVQLRLINSAGGKLNGREIRKGQVVQFGLPALFTGDTEKDNQEGWDTEGYLTITQDLPFPFNVVGIFGGISFGDG